MSILKIAKKLEQKSKYILPFAANGEKLSYKKYMDEGQNYLRANLIQYDTFCKENSSTAIAALVNDNFSVFRECANNATDILNKVYFRNKSEIDLTRQMLHALERIN